MRAVTVDTRLEAIAGTPLVLVDQPGTEKTGAPLGPYEDSILYAIYYVASRDPNYLAVAAFRGTVAAQGRMMLQTGPTGGAMSSRLDWVNGWSNINVTLDQPSTSRTPERVIVGWCQTSGNLTRASGQWGSSSFSGERTNVTVGGGMSTTSRLALATQSSDGSTPLAAVAYRGNHDEFTRRRVMDWLYQRYERILL